MERELSHDDFEAWLEALDGLTRDTLIPNEHRLSDAVGVPDDLTRRLADFGLFGMTIPRSYGGLELSMEQQVRATMCFTHASCCYRARFSTTLGLAAQAILYYGTEEQKQRYLPGMAAGTITAAFAVTEKSAGSDVAAIASGARRDGKSYVLDGTKRYITNANIADLFVIVARTDPDSKGATGLAAFLVERGTPGLSNGPVDPKMGQQGAPTAEVYMRDCRVPRSALLGGSEGVGFKNAMAGFNTARLHVAATCVGQAERLLEEALAYALERQQFGQPIVGFQSVANMLADCKAEIMAGKALVLDVARRFTNPPTRDTIAEISAAKYYCAEMVCRVADRAVQVLGGAGYLANHAVERLYRDVRLFRLFEGTSQIQQMVIARNLVDKAGREGIAAAVGSDV